MINSNFCNVCGSKLIKKINKTEGNFEFNFCTKCNEFKFEKFNTACSMIVFNKSQDKILLVKQYGQNYYILVAGYVMQGENAEEAAIRELSEELGTFGSIIEYNESNFYEKSNTLMINFAVCIDECSLNPNEEIDYFKWFNIDDAKKFVKPDSLASKFLHDYLNRKK